MSNKILIAPIAFNSTLTGSHLFQRIDYPDFIDAIETGKLPGININLPYHPFDLKITREFFTSRSTDVPELMGEGGFSVRLAVNLVSQYSPSITGVEVGPLDRDLYEEVARQIFCVCFPKELEVEPSASDSDGFKVVLCHYSEVIEDLSPYIDTLETRGTIIERRQLNNDRG